MFFVRKANGHEMVVDASDFGRGMGQPATPIL